MMQAIASIDVDFLELDDFVEEKIGQVARSRFYFGPIELYARMATRALGHQVERTLDLADISIKDAYRGKGLFSALLTHMEKLAERKGLALYVESISSPIIRKALARRGYTFAKGFSGNAWMSNADLVARQVRH
jgi:GNAT superfamily N-acetyltransferase